MEKTSQIDVEKRNKSYNDYVKQITPKASCGKNCLKAFVVGGTFCFLGQLLLEIYLNIGLSKDNAALFVTVSLVLLSVVLTGTGIYPKIAAFGGAGSLVPITGFANSVAAPAIEFKKEGRVFGIGCKIFTISGPVILYGIVFSFGLGLIYYGLNYLPFG